MSDDLNDYREIRRRVESLYNARKEIIIHTAVFAIINVVMWMGWRFTELYVYVSAMWLLLITGGWGAGYIAHLIDYLMKTASERAVQAAIERERAWRDGTLDEKPKREQRARLMEDGELEIITADEDYEEPRRRRR